MRTVVCPAELTIRSVSDLRLELLNGMESTSTLHIDATAVQRVDGAGLQLLLSVHRAAQEQGRDLVMECSAFLKEAVKTFGIAEMIESEPTESSRAW